MTNYGPVRGYAQQQYATGSAYMWRTSLAVFPSTLQSCHHSHVFIPSRGFNHAKENVGILRSMATFTGVRVDSSDLQLDTLQQNGFYCPQFACFFRLQKGTVNGVIHAPVVQLAAAPCPLYSAQRRIYVMSCAANPSSCTVHRGVSYVT